MITLFLIVYLFVFPITVLFMLYKIYDSLSILSEQQEEEKINPTKNKSLARKHTNIAKTTLSSPLTPYDPYDRYKDKRTNLYEPRKPHGGIKIEEFQGEDS